MSDNDQDDGLALQEQDGQSLAANGAMDVENVQKNAADLEAVFDVPVRVSAILGRAKMPVSELLNLDVGNVLELDRKVGEAVDIYVNARLVARGEVVLVEDKLGVTMTEIIKSEK
ncbi:MULTISPECIES: flagellar motor switch protein FliN [Cohaesibacter]|uniref:flagellar motor switch protein FliN n=1 Tax=Cohaesibacter TaxID=655352 RepID=UPI000DEB1D25|nr:MULTISPECIES: flagellar motor switch protein FliN [Cohaesibacter]TLP48162.1 flagellar motor switch protein FliN [Cohaesibacter sp. CAU 1516]